MASSFNFGVCRVSEARYRAEASNDAGKQIEDYGFRTGAEAQQWAIHRLPDASRLVMRNSAGQSKGIYVRTGGTGEWRDGDMWEKSV